MNLESLIVQSSKWFDVSSVQLSPLVYLESSFSSVRSTVAKCLRSVRSVQFIQISTRALPDLTLIDLTVCFGSAQVWLSPSNV